MLEDRRPVQTQLEADADVYGKNELLHNANKSDTVAFCPSSALCHVVGPVFQRQPMISVRKNTPGVTGWSWYFANSYMPAHWVRLATVIKGNF